MLDEKKHFVSATAIIIKDGKYLIAKRSPNEKAFPSKWPVPGGKLEAKDYVVRAPDAGTLWYNVMEDVVRREVKEEVNVEIGKPKYLLDLTFISPVGVPCLVLSYYAQYVSGEVKLSSEHIRFEWVDKNSYQKFENNRNSFVALKKYFSK